MARLTMQPTLNLPKWKCHKEVWAVKIADITPAAMVHAKHGAELADDFLITPADVTVECFHVDAAFVNRHKPEVGGYFVMYEDGYQSFSPAHAFEPGYTRI